MKISDRRPPCESPGDITDRMEKIIWNVAATGTGFTLDHSSVMSVTDPLYHLCTITNVTGIPRPAPQYNKVKLCWPGEELWLWEKAEQKVQGNFKQFAGLWISHGFRPLSRHQIQYLLLLQCWAPSVWHRQGRRSRHCIYRNSLRENVFWQVEKKDVRGRKTAANTTHCCNENWSRFHKVNSTLEYQGRYHHWGSVPNKLSHNAIEILLWNMFIHF